MSELPPTRLQRVPTHRIGNHPPQAKACTLQMSHIGSGSVLYVFQISRRLSTSGLCQIDICQGSSPRPSSSSTRSSTEQIVMPCATTSIKLAKTERILTCESPRKPNTETRSTLPIQKPKIAPMPELRA